jgi:hypothetical protein
VTSVLGARARCWGRAITGDDEDTHGRRNERRVIAGSESRRVRRGGQWLAGANDRRNSGVGLGWSCPTGEWTRGHGGRATSAWAPGSWRSEVGRRPCGLRGHDGQRSGDVGAGSEVVVAGGCRWSAALPADGRALPWLADLSVGWLRQANGRRSVERLSASVKG